MIAKLDCKLKRKNYEIDELKAAVQASFYQIVNKEDIKKNCTILPMGSSIIQDYRISSHMWCNQNYIDGLRENINRISFTLSWAKNSLPVTNMSKLNSFNNKLHSIKLHKMKSKKSRYAISPQSMCLQTFSFKSSGCGGEAVSQ